MPSTPPPPPPPLPPTIKKPPPPPTPPVIPPTPPPDSSIVELLTYNGTPFKDHWAYFIHPHTISNTGVLLHAAGDVSVGFEFEIKRDHEFDGTGRIPLQWVGGEGFDGEGGGGNEVVCGFERSVRKVGVPEKSLNVIGGVDEDATYGKKITQRDCQTWIIESADQLVKDNIFSKEVADYLRAIEQ